MGTPEPLRVAALTSGRTTPSRRYRVEQHLDALKAHGIVVSEHVSPIPRNAPVPGRGDPATSRVRSSRAAKAVYGACKLAAQLPGVMATRRADATWLQKELLPGYSTLERLTASPRVFDLDDAVWLTRPGSERQIASLVRRCRLALAGNEFLAGWCRSHGIEARVVPTAVDTGRWQPGPPQADAGFTIGWIGQQSNLTLLEGLEPVLAELLSDRTSRLLVCGDRRPSLPTLRPDQVRFMPWSEDVEVEAVRSMDVGLMPLTPGAWSEGKCSMKMLQYMACGIPAVVTPTGANRMAADGGRVAILAADHAQWSEAIAALRDDRHRRAELGSAGRRWVVERYSVPVVSEMIADALRTSVR